MKCEKCMCEHTGVYGSGRFCSSQCARSFATKDKRSNINETVSKKLKGRQSSLLGTKLTDDHIDKIRNGVSPEVRKLAIEKTRALRLEKYNNTLFENLSTSQKKRRVKEEQNDCCNRCGINEWLGTSITLEVEHKNGNTKDNSRDNLEALCPNCHSQTPTWRKKKSKLIKVEFISN